MDAQLRPRRFRPGEGSFCKAMVSIPAGVSTHAYSQRTTNERSSFEGLCETRPWARSALESRLLYVHKRVGKLYSVHFCTSFSNHLVTEHFSDHPHKRNFFLPLHPTPAFNENQPLIVQRGDGEGWDWSPAYLCLFPAILVTAGDTLNATRPVPALSDEERRRLDDLIQRFEEEAEDKEVEEEADEGDEEKEGTDCGNGASHPKSDSSRSFSTASQTYEADFPAIGAANITTDGHSLGGFGRYSHMENVRRWALEVAGLPWRDGSDRLHKSDCREKWKCDDDWSVVSGFSPADFARARNRHMKVPQVIFSDDLAAGFRMDEEDPAGCFMKEAREWKALSIVM
jgi:hypothetical protein